MLTAGGGRSVVTTEPPGRGHWLGWVVGTGSRGPAVGARAPPLAVEWCPSWNRGLESPTAVLGVELLGRKQNSQCILALGSSPGTRGLLDMGPHMVCRSQPHK